MRITLFTDGRLWLADYGTPGDGASILPWYQSTVAHNTVVVDGKSQEHTKENKVKLWLGEPDLEAAQSGTTEAYPGVAQTRTVLRLGDCFVVADRLESEAEHTYDLYLHSEGKLTLDGTTREPGSVAPPMSCVEKLTARTPATALSGCWAEGGSGVGFWMGGGSAITPLVGQCPAKTGSRKAALLVGRQQGRSVEFVTVLWPYKHKPDLAVERRANELIFRHSGSSEVLTLPTDGGRPIVAPGTN